MWAIQQFTIATDVWGVAVGRIRAPAPPSGWSITPRVLPRGAALVNVTITGTPTDGEGFYDPGPGFGCRLSAAVDGGVTVNAVTYNSPTSITLNVSTVSASNTAHALTITNPDGQTLTMPAAFLKATNLGDFDGDGQSDVTVYRPSNGRWYVLGSGTNYSAHSDYQWGLSTDTPTPGDYDGDGKTDLAVFRPASGAWYVLLSRRTSPPTSATSGASARMCPYQRTTTATARPTSRSIALPPGVGTCCCRARTQRATYLTCGA